MAAPLQEKLHRDSKYSLHLTTELKLKSLTHSSLRYTSLLSHSQCGLALVHAR